MLDSFVADDARGFVEGFTFQRLQYLVNTLSQTAVDFMFDKYILGSN